MRTYSASQVEVFFACARKWAWHYRNGLPRTSHPSAAKGTNVHGMLEAYRNGTPLPLSDPDPYVRECGAIALEALHHIPPPSTSDATEGHFMLDLWGSRFQGYIDLETDSEVVDYKTTSDFKWAKSPLTLHENPQAALYAAYRMVRDGTESAHLKWLYLRTKRPFKSLPVVQTVTREMVLPTLDRMKRAAVAMDRIHEVNAYALDLPASPDHCGAFGGCPYIELCNLTPKEILGAFMSQDAEAQRLAFLASINPPGAGAPPPPPPPAYAAPPPPPPPPPAPAEPSVPLGQTFTSDRLHIAADGSHHDLVNGAWIRRAPGTPSPFSTPVAAPPAAPVATAAKRGRKSNAERAAIAAVAAGPAFPPTNGAIHVTHAAPPAAPITPAAPAPDTAPMGMGSERDHLFRAMHQKQAELNAIYAALGLEKIDW